MSSMKSPNVVRSTVADTWRWMWPDLLMRILPLAIIPFIYIAVFHLPLAFLGLVLNNVPQQLAFGLLIGIFMAAFAATWVDNPLMWRTPPYSRSNSAKAWWAR